MKGRNHNEHSGRRCEPCGCFLCFTQSRRVAGGKEAQAPLASLIAEDLSLPAFAALREIFCFMQSRRAAEGKEVQAPLASFIAEDLSLPAFAALRENPREQVS